MFNRKKPEWREPAKDDSKNAKRDWILPLHEDEDLLLEDDIAGIEEHLRGLLERAMPAGDRCTADAK